MFAHKERISPIAGSKGLLLTALIISSPVSFWLHFVKDQKISKKKSESGGSHRVSAGSQVIGGETAFDVDSASPPPHCNTLALGVCFFSKSCIYVCLLYPAIDCPLGIEDAKINIAFIDVIALNLCLP